MSGHITAVMLLALAGIFRWRRVLDAGEATAIIIAISAVMYATR